MRPTLDDQERQVAAIRGEQTYTPPIPGPQSVREVVDTSALYPGAHPNEYAPRQTPAQDDMEHVVDLLSRVFHVPANAPSEFAATWGNGGGFRGRSLFMDPQHLGEGNYWYPAHEFGHWVATRFGAGGLDDLIKRDPVLAAAIMQSPHVRGLVDLVTSPEYMRTEGYSTRGDSWWRKSYTHDYFPGEQLANALAQYLALHTQDPGLLRNIEGMQTLNSVDSHVWSWQEFVPIEAQLSRVLAEYGLLKNPNRGKGAK